MTARMKHVLLGVERLRRVATMILVCGLPMLHAGIAHAAATNVKDQFQVAQNEAVSFSSTHRVAQIFTARMNGVIDRVRLMLTGDGLGGTTASVHVSIQPVTEQGVPSGSDLAVTDIPLSAVPPLGSPGWVDVAISARVVPGRRYAIVLSTSGGFFLWYRNRGADLYPDGYWANESQGWYPSLDSDAAFETYVVPPALDQSHTVQASYNLFGDVKRIGQTFVAGTYGMLDQVSVALQNYTSDPDGDIVARIYATVNGLPSGNPISEGSIPISSVPAGEYAWLDIYMTDCYVAPGNTYALVLGSTASGRIMWAQATNGSSYPFGNGLDGSTQADAFTAIPDTDAAFKTYVMPSVVDQAQAARAASLALGGIGMAAQTFTAGVTGYLDRVFVGLWNLSGMGPVTISIQTVNSNGYPSGTEIGRGTLMPSALGQGPVAITGNAYVRAGMRYAIVVTMPDGEMIYWWLDCCELYPAGDLFDGYIGSSWDMKGPNFDAQFWTYVVPAGIQAPAAGAAGTPAPLTLISSAKPATVGQPITFMATVGDATGTVQFAADGSDLGNAVPVAEGLAMSQPVGSLAVGSHVVKATYGGDNMYAATETTIVQDVQYAVGLVYKPRDRDTVGSTIPVKFELTNQSGQNLSSRRIEVQALCVVPTPVPDIDPCSTAPAGFDWTLRTPHVALLGPDSRYQFNVKTKGLDAGKTYQLLFRASGEPNTIYHADAKVTFTMSR